jgi:palmitoyl transferase
VITSDRGNDHALYALAFLDSHKNIQPNLGYYYQAIWGEKIRFGAGATVLVASRPDIFGGIPFPAIMPLFSVGTKNASVMFVPLPKLSNSENANNGNVLFIFGKFAYK